MSSLADIIARLEKATGPDRELDDQIALSTGYTVAQQCAPNPDTYFAPGKGKRRYVGVAPRFTASIDVALTLVLVGLDWRVGNETWPEHPAQRACAVVYAAHSQRNPDTAPTVQTGATPAIALCIAALKARAAA